MIIWLNGAYGSGKTTIAELLNKAIGDFFGANLPQEIQADDFQNYPEWRSWNIQMLQKLDKEYAGDVIVPMTLHTKVYFEEIFTALESREIEVHRFLLDVSEKELKRRLNLRNTTSRDWGIAHLEAELSFFDTLPTQEKINNERKKEIVIQEILEKIGI